MFTDWNGEFIAVAMNFSVNITISGNSSRCASQLTRERKKKPSVVMAHAFKPQSTLWIRHTLRMMQSVHVVNRVNTNMKYAKTIRFV